MEKEEVNFFIKLLKVRDLCTFDINSFSYYYNGKLVNKYTIDNIFREIKLERVINGKNI